ncbi:hypothetical protein ACOBV9_22385 (plasmid) [Pseudoalteromonas espejiana]
MKKLTLTINGEQDTSLNSEQVQAFLHEIVPPGIGDLFFFDGEKIAESQRTIPALTKRYQQKLLGIGHYKPPKQRP